MKRIIQMSVLLLVCLLHMNLRSQAQDIPVPRKNSVFLEGLGNGIIYSLNYDHLFPVKKHPMIGFGTRIGVARATFDWVFDTRITLTTLPAEVFFSYGGRSCLELGLGFTSILEENDQEGMGTFRLGYRYRSPGGIILGAGVLATVDAYGITFPYPQLSVGFSF